jgi:hypothetical protein
LIGFDRASHCRKIRDRPFADRRHHTIHRWVGDWQAIEAALVGMGRSGQVPFLLAERAR